MSRLPRARYLQLIWVPLVALCMAWALSWLPQYWALDTLVSDGQKRVVARDLVRKDTVAIDIDDLSLEALNPYFGSWPYKRDVYAALTDYLGEMGARAIVFDIVFSDARDGDSQFAKAIGRNGHVVLAGSGVNEARSANTAGDAWAGLSWKSPEKISVEPWSAALLPLQEFVQPPLTMARIGVVSAVSDADGVLRRLPLLHSLSGLVLPTLPLAAQFTTGQLPEVSFGTDGVARVGALSVPVDQDGSVHLYYPSNASTAVEIFPFHQVANALLGVKGETFDGSVFKGKTIFIGSSAFFSDRVQTPVGEMKGLYVMALSHQMLVEGVLFKPATKFWSVLLLLPLFLPSVLLLVGAKRSLHFTLLSYLGVALFVNAAHLLLLWFRQEAFLLFPLIAITCAGALESLQSLRLAKLQQEDRIEVLLHDDALTKLPNRFSMQAQLAQQISEVRKRQGQLAVLLIDLDHFKHVNDLLSHEVGDQLLLEITQRLLGCLSHGEFLARMGGDEFGVIISDAGDEEAARSAEVLLSTLSLPLELADQQIRSTASIGISLFPQDGNDVATLLKNADTALYQAKGRGRNMSCFFSAELSQIAMDQMLLEKQLREALLNGQFELHYQPQLDISTGQIVAVEALIRWRHPKLGLVMPSHFIPVAEKSDLILEIDAWVLRAACEQMQAWRLDGRNAIRQVAVNLSARQFEQPGLHAMAIKILADTGLPPAFLELEITESLAMTDPEHTIVTLNHLKKMGVTLAVDDFGTGHSSFAYLKHFPLDIVKIDRAFVRNIEADNHDATICAAIIALAHQLGFTTIAEGIETPGQFDLLRSFGCTKVQGFFVSPPVSVEELAKFRISDAVNTVLTYQGNP